MSKFESTRILTCASKPYNEHLDGCDTDYNLSSIWPSQLTDVEGVGYIRSTAYKFLAHDLDLDIYYYAMVSPNPINDTISLKVLLDDKSGVTRDICSVLSNQLLLESFINYMRPTGGIYLDSRLISCLDDKGFVEVSDEVTKIPIKVSEYSGDEFSHMLYYTMKVWLPITSHPRGIDSDKWWNGHFHGSVDDRNEVRKLLLVPYFMRDYALHGGVLSRLWDRALLMR